MIVRTAAAALVILAATASWAQSTTPATSRLGAPIVRQKESQAGMSGISTSGSAPVVAPPVQITLKERVQEMEGTLAKMHVGLKQMRTKAAANTRDPLAKANVDMWELLVGHLDNQLKELRLAMAVREDMESRRAAMYKQAEAKSEAEAQAARARLAGKTPASAPATQGAAPASAGDSHAAPVSNPDSPN